MTALIQPVYVIRKQARLTKGREKNGTCKVKKGRRGKKTTYD